MTTSLVPLLLSARRGLCPLLLDQSKSGNTQALVAAGRSGRVSGSSRFSGGAAGDALGAYAPVAGGDWFVLSRQPARIAEEVAEQMRRQALGAVGVAIGLAGLLSVAAYRVLVRPVREMIRA